MIAKLVTGLLAATIAMSFPAAANAQSAEQSNDEWSVGLTGYFWASGMNGKVGAIPGVQPVTVDMSFSDIFDHLKFAGMAAAQASHHRLVLLGDVQYVDLGATKNLKIKDADLLEGKMDTSTFIASGLAGYRIVDKSPMTFDLVIGGRVNSVHTKMNLSGPLRSVEGGDKKTWVDPIIGVQAEVPLSHKASLGLYGDVGGFGVSSDVTWQLWGGVQYGFSEHWSASAGWRHYAVDYHKGAFIYDVSLSGPIVGVRYQF